LDEVLLTSNLQHRKFIGTKPFVATPTNSMHCPVGTL